MAEFAQFVEGYLGGPVTDATGLSGNYDFDIFFTTDLDVDAPSLRSAIQSAGLKLESRKGPVEVIVVDHVEKTPTEN